MMNPDEWVEEGNLHVAAAFDRFISSEVLPALKISTDVFWAAVAEIVTRFAPRNVELLEERRRLEQELDIWHSKHAGAGVASEYLQHLREIGYLETEPAPFSIEVDHVDPEVASIAGPQLVVPLSNARFALNACNARWGSLYDALYGSDVISEIDGAHRLGAYNPVRGERVFTYVNQFLDQAVPLQNGSHADAVDYFLDPTGTATMMSVRLISGETTRLVDPTQFVGFKQLGNITYFLLVNHGLHIEFEINRDNPIGRQHPAGIADVVLEAAVTTIQDLEDSVATVDADDKVAVYRNWLGLMTGSLEATFDKEGASLTRRLAEDRRYSTPNGGSIEVPGRSLLFVRHVGLHMMTDIIYTNDGIEIPEGILDAIITVVIGMYDLRGLGRYRNSQAGSIYVVKPKLHGSAEVAFVAEMFAAIESLFGLADNTVKIGIMDEERRTSLNLAACIAAARERVVFINTGFLDRTGDEIHTAMCAGPVVPKAEMKSTSWLSAYERNNVDVGLAAGFRHRAQIGKGMWAMPDAMAEMVATKIAHPKAGSSCAWVPSPTAATLHAMHYHLVDVAARQDEIATEGATHLGDILQLPLLTRDLSAAEIADELSNNAQGILGYIVRWVNQGVGCSKVPDLHGIALMEDRATLRISSQHVANWLRHGIVSESDIIATFAKMAARVDAQNESDVQYQPMMPDATENAAFRASLELVFQGSELTNGYTEPILNKWRRRVKAGQSRGTISDGATPSSEDAV